MEDIVKVKTINELIENKVITASLSDKTKAIVGSKTIQQLVTFINDNIDKLTPSIPNP